jgi:hypothetical protein
MPSYITSYHFSGHARVWDHNLRMSFDAYSRISSTGISEIKRQLEYDINLTDRKEPRILSSDNEAGAHQGL